MKKLALAISLTALSYTATASHTGGANPSKTWSETFSEGSTWVKDKAYNVVTLPKTVWDRKTEKKVLIPTVVSVVAIAAYFLMPSKKAEKSEGSKNSKKSQADEASN